MRSRKDWNRASLGQKLAATAGLVFLPEHFATPAAHLLTLNSNLVRVTIQKG